MEIDTPLNELIIWTSLSILACRRPPLLQRLIWNQTDIARLVPNQSMCILRAMAIQDEMRRPDNYFI